MVDNFWITTLLPSIISFTLIYGWSKKWSCKPLLPELSKINRQYYSAITVLVSVFFLGGIIILFSSQSIRKEVSHSYGFEDVFGQTIGWILLLIPLFIVIVKDHLKFADLQYCKTNWVLSLVLGIIIGLLFLIASGRFSQIISISKASLLFAGIQYLIVGFAEETLFRGYVQVRFVARWGFMKGFLLTSVMFCLWHLPTYSIGMKMPFSIAIIEVVKIFPLSFLLGYSLEKTGNIITPAMIHLFFNWVQM